MTVTDRKVDREMLFLDADDAAEKLKAEISRSSQS